MNARRRTEIETRYRVLRRQRRWQLVRLIVVVCGITAASIWWLVANVRSC